MTPFHLNTHSLAVNNVCYLAATNNLDNRNNIDNYTRKNLRNMTS